MVLLPAGGPCFHGRISSNVGCHRGKVKQCEARHPFSSRITTTMLEFIFEVLGEFLLQVFGEALIEIGFHSLAEPFRRPANPWLAAIGYALFGAILGGISLLAFPNNLVPAAWRVANMVATPMAVGGIMAVMGVWRARRGQRVLRIDRFAYGYLFALSIALVRFYFAA